MRKNQRNPPRTISTRSAVKESAKEQVSPKKKGSPKEKCKKDGKIVAKKSSPVVTPKEMRGELVKVSPIAATTPAPKTPLAEIQPPNTSTPANSAQSANRKQLFFQGDGSPQQSVFPSAALNSLSQMCPDQINAVATLIHQLSPAFPNLFQNTLRPPSVDSNNITELSNVPPSSRDDISSSSVSTSHSSPMGNNMVIT